MSLTPFHYADHEVRVINRDGEPWFVLSDLCKVLDLSNVTRTAERLDPVTLSQAQVQNERGQARMAIIVSEPGMYEVVIRSDKPEAAAFRRWITSEVLPAIRKTGSYSVAHQIPQTLPEALRLAADEAEARMVAEAKVRELTPKAASFEHFLSADGDYSVAQAAQMLVRAGAKTGRNRLFGDMERFGWTYKPEGSRFWRAYQKAVDPGYLVVRAGKYEDQHTGEVVPTSTIRVTPKGLGKLAEKFGVVITEEHTDAAA